MLSHREREREKVEAYKYIINLLLMGEMHLVSALLGGLPFIWGIDLFISLGPIPNNPKAAADGRRAEPPTAGRIKLLERLSA